MQDTSHYDRQTTQRELREFSSYWGRKIQEWREQGLTNVELQWARSFWNDFLAAFGIRASRIALFERRATRANTGNTGYIDFFMPSMVIGEAKSLDKDLNAAQEQIDDYLAGGSITDAQFPKYSIVTNFETFRITRLDGTEPEVEIALGDLSANYNSLLFLIGKENITKKEEEEASIQAAQLMANLYTSIMGEDSDTPVGEDAPADAAEEERKEQQTSILMTRLLFLLYGDDAELWDADLFHNWVDLETNPTTLGGQLNQLFAVLNTPKHKRSKNIPELMAQFPYVNGSIFADSIDAEFFTPETRDALLEACAFRWNRISVSIFGAMFQLVKSKEARRAAGEHYTSEKNILKTIGPLFLDDYRARADKLIAKTVQRKKDQTREIEELLNEMASNIYCDPACGGGNFLNVAYAKMREIETDLLVKKQQLSNEYTASFDISLDQRLSINQFWGFEINWWPAKIAETAMFLVDHQANLKLAEALGDAPERLPIRITAHIVHANALRLNWAETLPEPKDGQTFIFGNPPFIGQYTKTKEQTTDMKHVWGKDYDGYLDFVTGWHAQAMSLFKDRTGEFSYVTTNSITQGQPVPALFGPLYREGWRIKFAHRTFAWDSEAPGKAAVHCVIVGFTRDFAVKQRLWDYENPNGEPTQVPVNVGINAYLVDGPNVLVTKSSKPLSSLLPRVSKGSQPTDGGNLIVEAADYEEVMADDIAAKYVRPFVGSKELIQNLQRWCLWLEDLQPADLSGSQLLRERLNNVTQLRLASPKAATRELAQTPALFAERRQPTTDYVAIPRVFSEKRKFATVKHLPSHWICSDGNFTAEDSDGFLFGLISSSLFMTWQKAIGGRLESRLRFSNTLVWNNFPVPQIDDKQREQIIAAGQKILEARALHPERSLSDHYNPLAMSPELLKAHTSLDRVVDKAFGSPRKLTTEEQRLELLFKNYQALTKKETK